MRTQPKMRQCLPSLVVALSVGVVTLGCDDSPTGRWRPKDFFADADVIALVEAVGRGDLKQIDQLIGRGVDVNTKGKDGITPLLWAMWAKNKPAFKRLLEHGANPNVQAKDGLCVTWLSAGTPLDSEWLAMVLKHGADPKLSDPTSGTTLLFAAVRSRRKKSLQLIVEAGADVNHQDVGGYTPLYRAASLNWFEGAHYLIEAGADYRIKAKSGADLAYATVDSTIGRDSPQFQWRRKVARYLEKQGVDLEPIKRKILAGRRRQLEMMKQYGHKHLPTELLDLGLDPEEEVVCPQNTTMPDTEQFFQLFNLAEGVLWITIGLGFLVAAGRNPSRRGLKLAACLLFVTFGLSDFVEIQTGGWYKPWWLLVWKAANICGLVLLFLLSRRRPTRQNHVQDAQSPP